MPRPLRVIVPSVPHHITQRGNYQQRVFHRDEDRRLYLDLLAEFLPHHGVALEGYCLMPNHVHLIATPHTAKGLSRALQRIHSSFARAIHLRLRRTGHLWQSRFHSVALDEEHFWAALLYVERNPVRAGLVVTPGEWRWSSARAHLGDRPNRQLDLVRWKERMDASRWKAYLERGQRVAGIEDRIRAATLSGFPVGDEAFHEEAKRVTGREVAPGRPGRRPKLLENLELAQGGRAA